MTDHPTTPPPELVQQWASEFYGTIIGHGEASIAIADQAARWGSDQELEACCEWLASPLNHTLSWKEATNYSANLRHARRPKPPSLKEQALIELGDVYNRDKIDDVTYDTIRKALEQLND
jgi:hypothetical protein